MKQEDALELLREAHREPIDEAHYAAVRARVLAGIPADRRRARLIWRFLFAGMAASALVLAFWLGAPSSRAVKREVAVGRVASVTRIPRREGNVNTAPHAVHRALASRRHAGRKPGGRPEGLAPRNLSKPLVVKMITDDPNVVIYWIAEGTGE
jgi:hypothetical protein